MCFIARFLRFKPFFLLLSLFEREAYYWLRTNTEDDATIMSWWDYGYQISGMANRTTLVDNNTWNNSHIAMVGRAMASNEDDAYEIMQDLGVDYVLGAINEENRLSKLFFSYLRRSARVLGRRH